MVAANFMQRMRSKGRTKRREVMGRTITYRRRTEDGTETVISGITATLGQQQIVNINPLGPVPSAQDVAMLAPESTNRDYFVMAKDLDALWPPEAGDVIEDAQSDDPDDEAAAVRRFELMSLPGQGPWRWTQGGEMVEARLHTKYVGSYEELWTDSFTGSDGTPLTSHSPNYPIGGAYAGDHGSIELSDDAIVAGDAEAARYFPAGSANPTISADVSAGMSLDDLGELYAEMGLAARCASSGSGLRNGYYYTVRIADELCKLRILKASGGTTTVVASQDLDVKLDPEATYWLQVRYQDGQAVLSISDDGQTSTIASVSHTPDDFGSNTSAGVFFSHEAGLDFSLPWIDDLYAEV